MAESSTIAALATSPAPAGIAVVRISGPKTKTALKAIFRAAKDPVELPRTLVFGELIDFDSGQVIDKALAVYMPGPYSYTGEDVGEFQFHGSPVLVQKLLRSLFAYGISPAEPGEFTKRAFLAGKFDLVQAEAIADLINATSEQSLKVINEHLKGRFSEALEKVGEPVREVLAELEASIDFPEEDLDSAAGERLESRLRKAVSGIEGLIKTFSYGHRIKEGFRILLFGPPNVGKSSILNRILGKERSIVTDISGTTRDLIEEEVALNGYRLVFCDTAGVSDNPDRVERIGIERARERIDWAELVLFVADASDKNLKWEQLLSEVRGKGKKIWMLTNKIDLNPEAFGTHFCDSSTCAQNFYISAKTGDGFQSLTDALIEEVRSSTPAATEGSNVVTNERHYNCLARAKSALERAGAGLNGHVPREIVIEEVRSCLNALEEIVGKTYTEDILGRIFSKFCVGK